ncbi:hypothetical protein E2320_014198, partial [Naja naja]
MGAGLRRWALPALALIWAALAAAEEQPAHLSSEVFFCQRDSPLYGLAQTLDNDLLFWFEATGAPPFQPETLSEAQIETRKKICDEVLPVLTRFSDMYIQIQFPEARGIPHVEVFTLRPLVLGQPNVLVCSARNIFPPVASIEWTSQGQPFTQGVSSTPVFPVQEMDFQIFSYAEVTPQAGDIYSCTVKGQGGRFDTIAYWVPKDPVASKLLENILCGLAVAVGGVFTIVGVVLLALSCRAWNQGGFVLHLETDCYLSADRRLLEPSWTLYFNKMPFTRFDYGLAQFVPYGLGDSYPWNFTGTPIAHGLSQTFPELAVEAAQHCQLQGPSLWAQTGDRRSEWRAGRSEHLKEG